MTHKALIAVVATSVLFLDTLTLGGSCACPWDCGSPPDGDVGIEDFLAVLGQWGSVDTSCDVDGGGVGITDLLKVLGTWGPCASGSSNVVMFDNTAGEFEWEPFADPKPCDPVFGSYLDITHGPSQSGAAGDLTFALYYQANAGTPHFDEFSITSQCAEAGPIRVAADDEPTPIIDEDGFPSNFFFVRELSPGDCVDGSANLRTGAMLFVTNYYTDPWTEIMIDTPAFVGVSFVRQGEVHYGWILFDAPNDDPNDFLNNPAPLMWAYELTPGRPITIPDLALPGEADGDPGVGIDDR